MLPAFRRCLYLQKIKFPLSLSLSLSPKRGGPQKEWFIFNSVEPSIYELSKPD